MYNITRLRSLVRRLGLRSLVAPFVRWMEARSLKRLGAYEAREAESGTLELTGFGKTLRLEGLPAAQCELGLSPHERPTVLAVMSRIQAGDCAWDVGANVGFYSRLMAAAAGPDGQVVSFEPSPTTYADLAGNVRGVPNIRALNIGLSDADGEATFATPKDHSSEGRIMRADDANAEGVSVIRIARGDTLTKSEGVPQPAFIKVDVEGHELEVLQGLREVLSNARCRHVLVEVHFTLLEQAGKSSAPDQIRALLSECGLRRQQWVARSHLLAER